MAKRTVSRRGIEQMMVLREKRFAHRHRKVSAPSGKLWSNVGSELPARQIKDEPKGPFEGSSAQWSTSQFRRHVAHQRSLGAERHARFEQTGKL